jgi:hypothetical protein
LARADDIHAVRHLAEHAEIAAAPEDASDWVDEGLEDRHGGGVGVRDRRFVPRE